MVDVVTSVEISAPIKRVSAYVFNQDNAPEWYVNIKSVTWITQKPLAPGSRFAFVANFLGRKLSYVYEVRKLSDTEMIMSTADGPFPMETTYQFERLSDRSTRMTLRNRGMPAGFSKLFSPFMASMMRAANKKDLKAIKYIIERQENT